MGIGFIWLYCTIAVLAVVGAIILWFLTKNIWATITTIVLFAVLAVVILLATIFTNKSGSTPTAVLYCINLKYIV